MILKLEYFYRFFHKNIYFRRQFDNIKRVYKMVEEIPGSIVENIKNSFYLSDDLAKQYASIVFLASIRFETSKKVNIAIFDINSSAH